MPSKFLRAACAAFALIPLLAACTYSKFDLPGQIGTYNGAIEETLEKALLVNIVRASEGAPVGFTNIAAVRGAGQVSATVGLPTITLGGGQVPSQKQFVFGPNGVVGGSNANFDLAVLESREFWLGLLTPLTPDTLAFFIRQGVSREMLFYLYVQRVEVTSGGKTTVLLNDPGSPSFASFVANLRGSIARGLTVDTLTQTTPYGPPLPAANVAQVPALLELARQGLSVRPISSGGTTQYQLEATRQVSVLCFDPIRATAEFADRIPASATCPSIESRPAAEAAASSLPIDIGSDSSSPATIKIYPRSSYDILRYLGSLVQAEDGPKVIATVDLVSEGAVRERTSDPVSTRLFAVDKNAHGGDAYLSVRYGKDTYSIRKSAAMSIRVLALLRQLIALSTSINALPSTGTVTTVVP